MFFLTLISCKKEKDDPIPYSASFTATINNQSVYLSESNGAIWSSGSGYSGLSTIPDSTNIQFRLFLGKLFKSDGDYKSSLAITFNNHINTNELVPPGPSGDISEVMFRELLNVGSYQYTYLSEASSGIIIEWYDDSGKFWASGRNQHQNNGIPLNPPDYNGSSFEVTYSTPAEIDYPVHSWAQQLSIKFSCFVFNNLGDSIWIDNGILNCKYSYGMSFNISLNSLHPKNQVGQRIQSKLNIK